MSSNKKMIVSLLIGYGLFSTQAMAEDFTEKVSEKSTISLIKYLKEKETEISHRDLSRWQGSLSDQDQDLITKLVRANFYNETNAESFVRSLEDKEVLDLSILINEDQIRQARQVVAATID